MLIEVLVFAVIAFLIISKYKQVLGTPPDEERMRQMRERQQQRSEGNVITLPGRAAPVARDVASKPAAAGASSDPDYMPSLAATLAQMQGVDRSFSEAGFLDGAKKAFQWIVDAFARGDREALKALLGDDVERNFLAAIDAREANRQTLEFRIERIREASISKAKLENGSIASITVEFVSEQVNILRDENGHVVEGEPGQLDEVRDIWTFRRDLKSGNPNWELVATATA